MPSLKTYTIPFHRPDRCNHQIIWVTDIHEDSCTPEAIEAFTKELAENPASSLLVGGDTSNGHQSLIFLEELIRNLDKSLYFVLGNHDFYGYQIRDTRCKAHEFCQNNPNLHYLTDGGVFALSDSTALIGHDGWADGRVGDFLQSTVSLGDYFLIDDLKNLQEANLLEKLNNLGDEAADSLGRSLQEALNEYSQVIILTHVPPFKEVCCYHGMVCDDNWGPHFVCHSMGQKILSIAERFRDKEILILCGHSHTHAEVQVAHNVRAVAAESVLGSPAPQGVIWYS